MKPGQLFLMRSKETPDLRLFKYLGHDFEWFDHFCNIAVQEVATGEISHIEQKWFEVRDIFPIETVNVEFIKA